MALRSNPRRLNNLQLKTLTILQELARHPETSSSARESGEVIVSNIPHPHGNHFHVGEHIVLARDATGLRNAAVWTALERKGLARSSFPFAITLTAEGTSYQTGLRDQILLGGGDQ